jgi:hypothetical protein
MVNPPRLVALLKTAVKSVFLVGLQLVHFCARLAQLRPLLTTGESRQRVAVFAQAHLHHGLAQLVGKQCPIASISFCSKYSSSAISESAKTRIFSRIHYFLSGQKLLARNLDPYLVFG